MTKYIYEFKLESNDFLEFSKKQHEFGMGILSIVNKYAEELKARKIIFDSSYGWDVERCIIKIKPLQEDFPESMKTELHQYYNSKNPLE